MGSWTGSTAPRPAIPGSLPTSTGLRRRGDVADSQHQRLAPLDRAFCADPDGLVERVEAFVESHGLLSAEAMEAYRALYADA